VFGVEGEPPETEAPPGDIILNAMAMAQLTEAKEVNTQ